MAKGFEGNLICHYETFGKPITVFELEGKYFITSPKQLLRITKKAAKDFIRVAIAVIEEDETYCAPNNYLRMYGLMPAKQN